MKLSLEWQVIIIATVVILTVCFFHIHIPW